MKTNYNLLLIDANYEQRVMIQESLNGDQTTVLSASTWEDAVKMVNAESISGVIFGLGTDPEDCIAATQSFIATESALKPKFIYLTDSEPQENCALHNYSEITQFVIKRQADLRHLLSRILNMNGISQCELTSSKEELCEVVKSLENYSDEIKDSLRYASLIQQAFLPGEESLRRVVNDSFLINKPKNVIGGDFFWFTVKYNRVIMAVADCTGHGVPGALLSMIGSNLLNKIVNDNNITSPCEILRQLNRNFQGMVEKSGGSMEFNNGMDIAVVCIDPDKRTVDFSGAGRPMMAFINGEAMRIKGNVHSICCSTPVSLKFENHSIPFGFNDTFYLASDGLCDQFGGEENRRLGTRKIIDMMASIQHMNQKDQKAYIEMTLNNWSRCVSQTDDIMVLGFRPASTI
jgi:serine phosphatase RsbU (regulator of sigma subunit)